jgi:hypothetical protein
VWFIAWQADRSRAYWAGFSGSFVSEVGRQTAGLRGHEANLHHGLVAVGRVDAQREPGRLAAIVKGGPPN